MREQENESEETSQLRLCEECLSQWQGIDVVTLVFWKVHFVHIHILILQHIQYLAKLGVMEQDWIHCKKLRDPCNNASDIS